MRRKVYYVLDKKLLELSKNIRNIHQRAFVVQALMASYDLFEKCEVISGGIATHDDLLTFHCSDYLTYLQKAQSSSNLEILTETEDAEDFNLKYDCPLFENIYEFVQAVAGSTLSAAKKLIPKMKSYEILTKSRAHLHSSNHQPRSYLRYKCQDINHDESESDVFELPANLSIDESRDLDLRDLKSENSNKNKICLSKTYVQCLNDDETQRVAINWFGGWHHAQRDSAEGFCYVNDIVIGIQYLLRFYHRILYVDLDVHHGNGVENAFLFTPRVFSLSIHKYETGFYPGSGSVEDIGQGNGRYYTANVPLKDGITNEQYSKVFTQVVQKVFHKYKPECLVVQCGADSITGDPLGGFNITPAALGECLKMLLDEKLPTLILGGGGYNIPNVARCWAYLTSVILDCTLSNDIPENFYFPLFGPGFQLGVTPGLRRNENSEEYLGQLIAQVSRNLDCLPDEI